MCINLSSLCRRFVVGCMEFNRVVGWVMGPKFSLCDGLDWIRLKKLDPWTTLLLNATFSSLHCRAFGFSPT